jgi:hypothetical protein
MCTAFGHSARTPLDVAFECMGMLLFGWAVRSGVRPAPRPATTAPRHRLSAIGGCGGVVKAHPGQDGRGVSGQRLGSPGAVRAGRVNGSSSSGSARLVAAAAPRGRGLLVPWNAIPIILKSSKPMYF